MLVFHTLVQLSQSKPMSHSFNIKINGELHSVLKEVEDSILKNGGKFKGDTNTGEFSGKTILGRIHGEYDCISEHEVKITIVKKPFATSKGKIESEIIKFFS